jgi:imidazolonepropionase-like amidohydrolase
MRFVARSFPALAPATILSLGTQSGAAALGLSDKCGTLADEKRADLVVVALPQHAAEDPHELLFHDDARIAAVYASGLRIR